MANPAKTLLEQLTSGAPVPNHPEDAVARARALAAAPSEAAPEGIADLPHALALAIIEAAIAHKSVDVLNGLTDREVSSKELAKAAKKALHQLRSAGVAVPEPKPQEGSVRPLGTAPTETLRSLLLPIDGTGDYGLIVVRPIPPKIQLNEIVVSDAHGAKSLQRLTGPRSQYRVVRRSLLGAPLIELSDDEVRTELGYAVHQSHASGTPFPDGFHVVLGHYEVVPLERPPLPPIEPSDALIASQSSDLFNEPLIVSWMPPEEGLRRLATRLATVDDGEVELTEKERADQIQTILREEAARFFTPEIRRLYAQRLWLTARFLEAFGQGGSADIARAEARTLFHGPADAESVFANALFEQVLRLSREDLVKTLEAAGV